MSEPTVQLHCRVPQSVYNRARRAAIGKHTLGALVADALVRYMDDADSSVPQVNEIAAAVLRMLKERL